MVHDLTVSTHSFRGGAVYLKSRMPCSSLAFLIIASIANADDGHWQSLFDGKSLEGWNTEDLDECFKVQDGAIGR
jgi:hypothetical protein